MAAIQPYIRPIEGPIFDLAVAQNRHVNSLILPSSVNSSMSFSRASTATAFGGVDDTLVEYTSGTARLDPVRGVFFESQRINSCRNPRAAGAISGSPGTLPSFWAVNGSSFTRQIPGIGTEYGIPYIDIRLIFSGAGTATIYFDTSVSASSGQTWALSTYLRLVGGSTTNTTCRWFAFGRNASNTIVESPAAPSAFTPTSAFSRPQMIAALSNATTVSLDVQFRVIATAAADLTLRFYGPQYERGLFPSSPILPPVGSPAVTTRQSDLLSTALTTFGIPSSGEATLWGSIFIPSLSVTQTAIQIDDGSDNNSWALRCPGSSAVVEAVRTTSASSLSSSSETFTLSSRFNYAITYASGIASFSTNGAAVRSVSGGPTSGFTTLRFGSNASGGSNLFGYVTGFCASYSVSDSDLRKLSS